MRNNRVLCPRCRGSRFVGPSPCTRCAAIGDLPEIESCVPTKSAAMRGGCPWCSASPGTQHGTRCRGMGRVLPLHEQEHQPEYRSAARGAKGRYAA